VAGKWSVSLLISNAGLLRTGLPNPYCEDIILLAETFKTAKLSFNRFLVKPT
jgi:hypothetical protein